MDGSIKAIFLCQMCRLWVCVCEQDRDSVREKNKKKRLNESNLSGVGQREIQLPICIATSLHGHQKQIRCCGKWPREIVSWNSMGQLHDLSGGGAAIGWGAIELIQIYIVENSICSFGSSKCFRFTRHQSNLFVGIHQDVRVGLHTVIPIQFVPAAPHVLTVAQHRVHLLGGQWS